MVSQQAALTLSRTTPSGVRWAAGRVMVRVALVTATSGVRISSQRAVGRFPSNLRTLDHLNTPYLSGGTGLTQVEEAEQGLSYQQ
jgi:hypothetical protein